MKRTVLLLVSIASAVLIVAAAGLTTAPTAAQESPAKPNFIFILADDMRKDELRYMPKTKALLGEQGMRFPNAYVAYALCCPSRATIMRGQYAHNHGVWSNKQTLGGGWKGYKQNGNEQDNVATRLHDAGYRTGYFGKYLNGYKDTTVIPEGWDDWFVPTGQEPGARHFYFNYDVNDNGVTRHFGSDPEDYSTDVIKRQTREFIGKSVAEGKPFFAYLSPNAPHYPAIPAPRHEHAFDGEKAPRLPSFNEKNVSDKPPLIRSFPLLGEQQIAKIDAFHERRAESLQSVDALVEGLVEKLRSEGELSNTYIVFTSDNGWHHGEHRIPNEKNRPYEESIHVPLLIRGPDVQAGSTTDKLTLNTDFFPTFTDLAGIPTPEYVDGRSLRPLLEGDATKWRTAILFESNAPEYPNQSPFYGLVTSEQRKYVEYDRGFRELYDLRTGPYEGQNIYNKSAPPKGLATRLDQLKTWAGPTCRAAENGSQ
ncbi:MAG: sulfatase [Actinomycetota bacterium]|nr:sulfatase [Actinomycetota bacterium]